MVPNVGVAEFYDIFDFKNHVHTQFNGGLNQCKKEAIEYDVNIEEWFNKIADPSSGLMNYVKETTIPWAAGNFYEFELNLSYPDTSSP